MSKGKKKEGKGVKCWIQWSKDLSSNQSHPNNQSLFISTIGPWWYRTLRGRGEVFLHLLLGPLLAKDHTKGTSNKQSLLTKHGYGSPENADYTCLRAMLLKNNRMKACQCYPKRKLQ